MEEEKRPVQPFNFSSSSTSILEEIDRAYRDKDVYVRYVQSLGFWSV